MPTLTQQLEEALALNRQCAELWEASLRLALERIAQLEQQIEERDYQQAQTRYERRAGAA